jgi:hypothetical protein
VSNGGGTLNTYGGELMVAIYTQLLTEPSQIYTSYGEVPVKEFIVTCIAMVYKYLSGFYFLSTWSSYCADKLNL